MYVVFAGRIADIEQGDYKEVWKNAVWRDATEQGFDEWFKDLVEYEGKEIVLDDSFSGTFWGAMCDLFEYSDPFDYLECVACGRIFDTSLVFDEVYNHDILDMILLDYT